MASARRPTALLLAAVATLAAGGCSVANPITTQGAYAPSDGVRATVGTSLSLENVLVLSSGEGEAGALLAGVSNNGRETTTVTLSLTDGTEVAALELGAGRTALVGPDQEETIELETVPVPPGAFLEMRVASERDGAAVVLVPVLDGTLPEYADLVP